MRLFIGIDLTPEVIRSLEELLQRLKPAAQINWSPPRNLHITTKFVGEWPEERLAELKSVLGTLPARQRQRAGAGSFDFPVARTAAPGAPGRLAK